MAQKKYSKQIVILIIVLNIVFTIAVMYLGYFGTEIPEELISNWFTFTGVELGALAGIKITDTVAEVQKDKYDKLAANDKPNSSDIEED